MTTKTTPSAIALACAAQLSTEIVMRLSGNGVSGTVDGNFITRTTVASAALHTITGTLSK